MTLQCLNNLRQMAVSATGYAVTNDGRYPIAYYTVNSSTAIVQYNWDFTTTISKTTGLSTVTPGLLWQGNTNEKVQQCPVFAAPATPPPIPTPATTTTPATSVAGNPELSSYRRREPLM